jgi:hypothetical protein
VLGINLDGLRTEDVAAATAAHVPGFVPVDFVEVIQANDWPQ